MSMHCGAPLPELPEAVRPEREREARSSEQIRTKSVSREIERRVGTKTASFWARNRLNLRSTGIEYMYNAKYMYLGIAAASIQIYNPI